MPETTGSGEQIVTQLRTRVGVTLTQDVNLDELGWLTAEEKGIVLGAPSLYNKRALAVDLLNAREEFGAKEALIAEVEAARCAEDHPAPAPLAPAPREVAGF
jgi:hypothetical protein